MKQLLILLAPLLLIACTSHQAETTINDYELHGDTVIIAKQSPLCGKIKEDTLGEQSYRPEIFITGIVKAIPNQYAEISPLFDGRITRSYSKLGMKVKVGTPLFELNSPNFVEAQKLFFQAKEELLLAEKKLKRQQNLSANGVGTQKDLEEAQANYEIERKEFENARLAIRLFNADPDKLILGQALVVCAPITGEIVEDKIVVGQFVKSDAASIARIAELSSVWVAGQVKEKDMNFIRFPQECRVSAAALAGEYVRGSIRHVSSFVNEDTRSMEILIECNNKDRSLKPGMYVTVDFIQPPVNTILIPAKSVLQQSNASFVFKRVAKGKYIKQAVEAKIIDAGKSVIQAGLAKNDVIISDGAYFLTTVK